MHTCPCCYASLLQHVRQNKIYWYCDRCRQEMPNLELILTRKFQQKQSHRFPPPPLLGQGNRVAVGG